MQENVPRKQNKTRPIQQPEGSQKSSTSPSSQGLLKFDVEQRSSAPPALPRKASGPAVLKNDEDVEIRKVESYGRPLRDERELQSLTPEQQKVEGGLTGFFNSLIRGVGELIRVSTITLFSGILGAALLPFFGPVVAIGVSLGVMAAVTEIQEKLKPLGLGLQDDTVRKLAEPLQGKRPDERDLQKVMEEVLSKDRQANEDLAKAFRQLLPTIHKAAAATNIEFSGPVQGLTIGDHNTITETFNGFLQDGL